MSNLPITNVINVSVSSPPAGLSDYQVNNLAIGTKETPINPVLGPALVAAEYTTALTGMNNDLKFTADTAGSAGNAITIAYINPATPSAVLGVVVTDNAIVVNLATDGSSLITSTGSTVLAALQASMPATALITVALAAGNTGAGVVTALAVTPLAGGSDGQLGIYRSITDVATDWGTNSEAYSQAAAVFAQTPNILNGGGQLIIVPMDSGDTIASIVAATLPRQYFHGFMPCGYNPSDDEYIAGAATCEASDVLLAVSQYLTSTLTPTTGLFAILADSDVPHARRLLYTQGASFVDARYMAAGYFSRAMSVDFNGSATVNTMQLKQLATVEVDDGITQAILDTCKTLGVDTYVRIAGRPSVFSTTTAGSDSYFDAVYNQDWLVLALGVAGFNALATTSTKVPQTEPGMAVLRGAYINVLNQAVVNGYLAPGAWNSPELFGNPADLKRNVLEQGWYIYSAPVNLQSQSQRQARVAPLIQIAAKEAGAIHSSNVVVYVNP